jgi:hypothetical protein
MNNIALCPNCGGQKTITKPPYIAGDVNAWVSSSTPTYPCPTCEGRGWIRVDSVSQDEFGCIKSVALSSMETAETLMDECAKRADMIKELETELEHTTAWGHAVDKEIEKLRMKIFDIEGREDLVTAELEHRADVAENQRDIIAETNMKNLVELGDLRIVIHDLESVIDRDTIDLELLDDILKIVNPLIKSGDYAKPAAESRLLAIRMHGVCQTVVQFRRKYNIVG